MLVLSRNTGETIVINEEITVTVIEVKGDKVRLGIVADKIVPVDRLEIHESKHGKTGLPFYETDYYKGLEK